MSEPNSPEHEGDEHGSHAHHKPKKVKPSNCTLNVTSMVDILFNLLVYFIVTASVVLGEGALKAALPGMSAAAASEEPMGPPKYITLVPSGMYACSINFDGASCPDFNALYNTLQSKKGAIDPVKDSIIIRPGVNVRWQHVVNAFNQAVRAGYQKVSFAPAGGGS